MAKSQSADDSLTAPLSSSYTPHREDGGHESLGQITWGCTCGVSTPATEGSRMIDHFIEHSIFELFDFIGFWILAGVVCGGIWVYERWFEKR